MTVLTRQQLLVRLGSRHALAVALACGQWERVLVGAYTDGPLDLQARAEGVHALLPPAAVVAGRSALWLCGATQVQDPAGALEVLVPRGATVPRRPGLLAREGDVPPDERGAVGGVRCLRPSRAAVDVARQGPLASAVAVLDAVLAAGLTTEQELAAQVERAAGLRGVCTGRRALELADARAASPPESWLRVVLVEDGLVPVPQYVVLSVDGRFVARVDLAFPADRVALEYDGRVAHATAAAFARDRQRQNELVALGWVVLRFTAADLRSPAGVVYRVREVLGTRRTS